MYLQNIFSLSTWIVNEKFVYLKTFIFWIWRWQWINLQ